MQTNAIRVFAIAVLALGLMAGQSEAATVYAKIVAGTVYFESGASSCDDVTADDTSGDLEAALTAAGASGTLNICAGTYTGAQIDAADGLDTTANSQTINGIGAVIIDMTGVADEAISIGAHSGTTINDLELTGSNTDNYNLQTATTSSATVLNGVTMSGPDRVYYGRSSTTFNRCVFSDGTDDGGYNIYIYDNAPATTMNYCTVTGFTTTAVQARDGDLVINNSLLYGNAGRVISTVTNAISTTINNSVFFANNSSLNDYFLDGQVGTRTVNNSVVHYSMVNWAYQTDSWTMNNCFGDADENSVPGFQSYRGPLIVVFMVDDTSNQATFDSVATMLEAKGWGGSWAIDHTHDPEGIDSVTWATIQGYIDSGHEAVSHTRHEVNFEDLSACDIQYTAGACTMTINQAAGALTTSVGGSWTLANYADVIALCAVIEAAENYTCSVTANDYAGNGLTTNLADVTAQDINSAPYTILYDENLLFAEEILGSKTDLEANLTAVGGGSAYTARTFLHPGHKSSANSITYAKDTAGYEGVRGKSTDEWQVTVGVNVYQIKSQLVGSVFDGNQRVQQATQLAQLGHLGGVVVYYIHGFSAAFTEGDFQNLINDVYQSNATVMTLGDAADYIKANWTDSGDGRSFTTTVGTADYQLEPWSILIGAGTSIAGLHDTAGKVDYFNNSLVAATSGPVPTIGAEAFQAVKWVYGVDDGAEYTEIDCGDADIQGIVVLATATTPTIYNTTVARCDRGGITSFKNGTSIKNTISWNDTATVPSVSAATGVTLAGNNNFFSDNALDGAGAESFTAEYWSQPDPFVAYSTGDFNLARSASNALNKAANLCSGADTPFVGCTGAGTGSWVDIDGDTVPRGQAPDIGAYEYQKSLGRGSGRGGMGMQMH